MPRLSSPIKWHGGKYYLAPQIVALYPPHLHRVHPYAGGIQELFASPYEGVSEVINDTDGQLTNFWAVLSSPEYFAEFQRRLPVPFCEAFWQRAMDRLNAGCKAQASDADPTGAKCLPCAVAFFVANRQSLAGRMQDFAPLTRTRLRRGMNEQASAWMSAVDGLPEVAARLERVVVLNRNALDVINQQDGPDTLFYCDPPYLGETRASPAVYRKEVADPAKAKKSDRVHHAALLGLLSEISGKFMLSGYRSRMYDEAAKSYGWNRHDFDLPNNAAGGGEKRRMTECIWCNF